MLKRFLGTLLLSLFIFVPVAHAATPDGDFDVWLYETHSYLDGLQKAEVAEEWGAAGWGEAVQNELARQADEARRQAFIQSLIPKPASVAPRVTPSAPSVNTGGALSYSQLLALANCEGSGVNGWRTGYFGIEAGYPIGNLSWDEQVAWVQRIYAQHGASAWGVLCRPILGG